MATAALRRTCERRISAELKAFGSHPDPWDPFGHLSRCGFEFLRLKAAAAAELTAAVQSPRRCAVRKVPAPEVIRFLWDLLCFLDTTVRLDLG
jgi:hypothetical protein